MNVISQLLSRYWSNLMTLDIFMLLESEVGNNVLSFNIIDFKRSK